MLRSTLIALACVALVACGGPAAPAAPTVADITQAVDKTVATGTARIHMVVTFKGSTMIPEGTSFAGDGQASFGEARQMTLTTDMTALGLGKLEMILDGTIVYMRGETFETLAGDKWLRLDLGSDHPAVADLKSIASGQNDASLALYYLFGADGTPSATDGTIDGQAMRVVAVPVDLRSAIDRVPARIADMLRSNVSEIEGTGVDPSLQSSVWIGSDGLIHRVDHVYTLGSAQGGGTTTAEFHLSRLGDPLDLAVPGASEIVDVEDVIPR
jgi:hypothetical protein